MTEGTALSVNDLHQRLILGYFAYAPPHLSYYLNLPAQVFMVKLIFHEIKLLANGFFYYFHHYRLIYIIFSYFYEMSIKVGMNAESMVRTQKTLAHRVSENFASAILQNLCIGIPPQKFVCIDMNRQPRNEFR